METVCPSCRKQPKAPWKSEWDAHGNLHDHYESKNCDCGYKIFRKTDHFHSGHR